jgi:hypothetical protein
METPEVTSPLTEQFQAFYEAFTEFTHQVADLHSTMPVHDDASRAVYNSLSRIMAMSDPINIMVSLMREDVRVVEELTSSPLTATWTEHIEHCFYDWLRAAKPASQNAN